MAACQSGVIGSFPTHNARSSEELDAWLSQMTELPSGAAPFAPNVVVHRTNRRLEADIGCLVRHRPEVVITSVGSPRHVIGPLHDADVKVLASVASLRHVDAALEAGADGLVLLTAGAGGQTGVASPFAFTRAVRARFNGPLAVAGGISDGVSLLAVLALGADLGYLGTKFIATFESAASQEFKAALVASSLDDIALSGVLSGLPANYLRQWLDRHPDAAQSKGADGYHHRRLRDDETWSAGHSVSGVSSVRAVADLVAVLAAELEAAASRFLPGGAPRVGRAET